ncbi:tyrosine-type recombinase/integrase [Nocardioides humi]|uniref:Site-specific integrase n=1 Tax=Nocardioides humi TaxID=449461 RepID=A0ABN2BNZ5_9ACTN|nr:site-specific integrase [Nocardioides humi]
MAQKARRRFGQVTRMRSGRWQARFSVPANHPSGRGGQSITAPHTFEPNSYGKQAAQDWLRAEELRLQAEGAGWLTIAEHAEENRRRAVAEEVPTFSEYAAAWLRSRKVKGKPLQESTKRGYLIWLNKYLLPTFGDMPLNEITPASVVSWYDDLPHEKAKTVRETYSLAKAIMKTAVAADGVLPGAVNPFAIEGASTFGKRSEKRTEVIEDRDLAIILDTIRPEWRAMVALALGCGLRYGELAALRRSDINLRTTPPVVHVRRAVGTGPGGQRYEKPPKSAAGVRDQRIPESVVSVLTEHLHTYVTGRTGLLFPGPSGDWLRPTRFRDAAGGWYDVREAVGRGINFHDLRATGATRLAQRGAHVAEVQAFLGDASSQAAERYVRATQSRMDDLTAAAFAGLNFGGKA